jgi:peptidylprolyl isomerase
LKAKKARALRKKIIVVFMAVLVVVALVVVYSFGSVPGPVAANVRVLLVTSMGNVTVELYGDMPVTTENFLHWVGVGAYNGTIFHRVVAGFVVQGGNISGNGFTAGTIVDELPNKHSNVRGSVAMAKASDPDSGQIVPNSATSEFYINLVDNTDLDSNFSVFGRVVAGLNVVDDIGGVAVVEAGRPLEDVTLISASIVG